MGRDGAIVTPPQTGTGRRSDITTRGSHPATVQNSDPVQFRVADMRRVRRATVIRERPHSNSLSRRGWGSGQGCGRDKWRLRVNPVVAVDTGPPPDAPRKFRDDSGLLVKNDKSEADRPEGTFSVAR